MQFDDDSIKSLYNKITKIPTVINFTPYKG